MIYKTRSDPTLIVQMNVSEVSLFEENIHKMHVSVDSLAHKKNFLSGINPPEIDRSCLATKRVFGAIGTSPRIVHGALVLKQQKLIFRSPGSLSWTRLSGFVSVFVCFQFAKLLRGRKHKRERTFPGCETVPCVEKKRKWKWRVLGSKRKGFIRMLRSRNTSRFTVRILLSKCFTIMNSDKRWTTRFRNSLTNFQFTERTCLYLLFNFCWSPFQTIGTIIFQNPFWWRHALACLCFTVFLMIGMWMWTKTENWRAFLEDVGRARTSTGNNKRRGTPTS